MKFGLEPVGSPTKIALVCRSISVAVFIAAENVLRPTILFPKELDEVTGIVSYDEVRSLVRSFGKGPIGNWDIPLSEDRERLVEIVYNDSDFGYSMNEHRIIHSGSGLFQR